MLCISNPPITSPFFHWAAWHPSFANRETLGKLSLRSLRQTVLHLSPEGLRQMRVCVYSHHLDKWDVTVSATPVSHTSDTPHATRHILSQVLLTSVGELASTNLHETDPVSLTFLFFCCFSSWREPKKDKRPPRQPSVLTQDYQLRMPSFLKSEWLQLLSLFYDKLFASCLERVFTRKRGLSVIVKNNWHNVFL